MKRIPFIGLLVIILFLGFSYLTYTVSFSETSFQADLNQSKAPIIIPIQIPTMQSTVASIEDSLFQNIQNNGFDPNAQGVNEQGGLYENWIPGTKPLLTDMDAWGTPAVSTQRENMLRDLSYVYNLYLAIRENPMDLRAKNELAKYEPLIKKELTNPNPLPAWTVTEYLMNLSLFSTDPVYEATAVKLATLYYTSRDLKTGIFLQKDSLHPYGYYSPTVDIEEGIDLVLQGEKMNNAAWEKAGNNEIHFVTQYAFIPSLHLFPAQNGNIFTKSGKINQVETFYHNPTDISENGNEINIVDNSHVVLSLMQAYTGIHDQRFLTQAKSMFDQLEIQNNKDMLWDSENLGYYPRIFVTGNTINAIGTIKIQTNLKESDTQSILLKAVHQMNLLTSMKYQMTEKMLLSVITEKIFKTDQKGVIQQLEANWSPIQLNNHTTVNWINATAMNSALTALFQLQFSYP